MLDATAMVAAQLKRKPVRLIQTMPSFSRPLSSTQRAEFEELARDFGSSAGYKWLTPDQVPTAIPKDLSQKFTSALLMWERTSSGVTCIVCNGIRLDAKANELDQEPFGVAVYSSGASTGGIFIHDGDWLGRTTPITGDVRSVLSSTSLGNYFPLGETPNSTGGPLSDLTQTSHRGAFDSMVQQLIDPST